MVISKKVRKAMEGASWIRKMFEEGEELKRRHGEDEVFDFSLGNPEVDPPLSFYDELRTIVQSPLKGMHRYMPNNGYPETRAAIAGYLREETALPFEENHIVMTAGAAGGLNVVFKALLDEGDEVVVPSPYFMEFRFYIDNCRGEIRVVETNEDFTLDLAAIEKAIGQRTKAVLINSPNNPTGVVYDSESIDRLGKILEQKSRQLGKPIFLISDEAYRRIVYDGIKVPIIFHHYRNSIRVTSHSKDLALAGERIGYVAVHPRCEGVEEIVSAMIFAIRVLGFVNAPALMQRVVGRLQGTSVDIAEYQQKRDLLYNSLRESGYEVVKPQGAFYLFPRSPNPDDLAFVNELQSMRILTVPGRGFGKPGYFRIAYCVDTKTIERALPGFREVAMRYRLSP